MSKRIKGIIAAFLVVAGVTTNIPASRSNVVYANERGKAKNVIMLIADGMSTEGITLARQTKGGNLAMDEISVGSVITSWANGPITDSAPGGTVYAAGEKTNNKYIGTSVNDTPIASIVEGAESIGKATGIIATSEITHATPADFTAHTNNRKHYNQILQQQINQDMEVVLGGGFNKPSGFTSEVSTDEFAAYYEDQVNNIKEEGFDFITTKDELDNYDGDKLWGSFADADLKYDFDRQSDNDNVQPSLAEMTDKAIEVLNKDEYGFFLMVEGSKIDWAAHANDPSGTIGDILAFDEAIKVALDYAKENQDTIVVVTTDHANSGFSIGNESTTSGYDDLTFEESIMQIKDFKLSAEKFTALVEGKSDDEVKALIYDTLTVVRNTEQSAYTVSMSDVENVEGKAGVEFKVPVVVNELPTDSVIRASEMAFDIPEDLEVKAVELNNKVIKANNWDYNVVDGKLRVALANLDDEPIFVNNTSGNKNVVTLTLALKEDKSSEDSTAIKMSDLVLRCENDVDIEYNTKNAKSTITFVEKEVAQVSARELYVSEGVDVIPENMKAVASEFTLVENTTDVKFGDTKFYYSPEFTEKTGKVTYIALVSADTSLDSLSDINSYTLTETAEQVETVLFGDINNDGIDAQDALAAVSSWLRKTELNNKEIISINVNADGRINTRDAIDVVDNYIAGKEFKVLSK